MYSRRTIKKLANDVYLNKLQDYLLTYDIGPSEKLKRSIALTDFWVEEGEKYIRLLKKINKEDEVSFEDFFSFLGYWFRFKLLCEGKEPTIENVIDNRLDFHALNIFMKSVIGIK